MYLSAIDQNKFNVIIESGCEILVGVGLKLVQILKNCT